MLSVADPEFGCERGYKKGIDITNYILHMGICGISICTSDSGGPLVQGNVLIGIVSWGKLPCGQANSPSVYVQVSSFISWISANQQVP